MEEKNEVRIDNAPDNVDFSKIKKKVKKNPWIVSTVVFGVVAIILLYMSFNGGLTGAFVGVDSLSGDEVISNEYAKGLSYVVPETSLSENFKEKLHQLPGYENLAITIASPYGYDAMKIIINAVTKVGTDKEKIIEELTKTKYIGVSNPLIEFNKFGGLKTARYEVKTVT